MADLLERHGHLALAAETGLRRYQTGAYRAWALQSAPCSPRRASTTTAPSWTPCLRPWPATSSPASAPPA
jgi:hypothetical protein